MANKFLRFFFQLLGGKATPAPVEMPLEAKDGIRLVAGLGNPGARYEGTRHNVGFMVLDAIAAAGGFQFAQHRKWEAEVAKEGALLFLKPQTFMNLSGRSVSRAARFHKLNPSEILVVYDDASLPIGALRFRPKGGAGGQNGMRSIIAEMGTDAIPRLRVGVGGPPHPEADLANHVLGKFDAAERSLLDETLARAIEAVTLAAESGLESAMNTHNRRGEGKS